MADIILPSARLEAQSAPLPGRKERLRVLFYWVFSLPRRRWAAHVEGAHGHLLRRADLGALFSAVVLSEFSCRGRALYGTDSGG
jgi:hypothetical protein